MTSSPSGSDSDDIEILSIHIASQSSGGTDQGNLSRADKELLFMWNELSHSNAVTNDSLKNALNKYDVIASDEQVSDMISIFSETNSLTLDNFKQILNRI